MTWSQIACGCGNAVPSCGWNEEDLFLQARLVDLLPGAGAGGDHRLHWLFERRRRPGHSMGDDSIIFAAMFQFFFLRGGIFFGCVGIFSNLFRAEMLERTLHYYYLTPLRREMLVAESIWPGSRWRCSVRGQRGGFVPHHRPPFRRRLDSTTSGTVPA
jgi:hypothetical protein